MELLNLSPHYFYSSNFVWFENPVRQIPFDRLDRSLCVESNEQPVGSIRAVPGPPIVVAMVPEVPPPQ